MTITKLFNNNSIEIREDGFFNATLMCKAFGKKAQDYMRLDTTKAFIEALKVRTGYPDVELVQIQNGGRNPGTWVERRIAIDIARWLSPDFHVQVIEWAEEILSGQRPQLPDITSEDEYIRQMVDLFSRTNQPLQKEVIIKNTLSDHPSTRRLDMKVFGKNIYYEVKMHTITMSDLQEIFFNRKYPELLSQLHSGDYQLYMVSPKGISDEAKCFVDLMKNVYYIHGEELAFQAAELLLESEVARTQIMKHILPSYCHLLPSCWRDTLKVPKLKTSPELIYNGKYPLGVVHEHKSKPSYKPFRARFRYEGRTYSFGYYLTPEEAGEVVRKKMLEIKGYYN
ncbi:MAG: KilA-N domain-containing protein [Planktothrix sp.]